uniref:Uncharacterized protein n=1 Tax=Drosophila melanogaster TaxID=7227 RepID=Q7KV35_DROME|nr:uncharacterized protein Dmel_CG33235 [Drosophila melanogaster]AAS65316.1 uncharacterized protein Dmel_CG33235 [Drosophila melanogaster]|eukprot:NP_996410.1 uncharacterized protein Dmel_CG33235 [Drosophila melanogaster]
MNFSKKLLGDKNLVRLDSDATRTFCPQVSEGRLTLENVIFDRGGSVTTKKPRKRPTPKPVIRNFNNLSVPEEVDVDNLQGQRKGVAVNSNNDEMMISSSDSSDSSDDYSSFGDDIFTPGPETSDTSDGDSSCEDELKIPDFKSSATSKDEKLIPSSKWNFTLTKDIIPPGEGKKSHIGASLPEPVNRNFNNKSVLDLQGQRNQGSRFGAQGVAVNSNKDEMMISSSDSSDSSDDYSSFGDDIFTPGPETSDTSDGDSSCEDELKIPDFKSSATSKDKKMIPSSKRNFTLTKDIIPPGEGKKSHIGASLPEPVNRNSNNKSVLDLLGQRNQGVNSNKDELTILSSDTSDTSKEEKMIPSSKRNFFLTKDIIPPGEGKKSHIGASLPEPVNRNSNSKSVLDLLGQRNQGVNSNKDELTILSSDTSDTSKEEKMIPSSKRNFFLTKDNIPPGEGKKSHIGASLPEPVDRTSNNKSVLDLQGQRNQGSKDEKMIPSSKRNFTLTKDIIPPGEGKKSHIGASLPEPLNRNSNNKSVLDLQGQRDQGSKDEKMIPSSKRNFTLTKDIIPPGEGKKSHIGASLPEPVNRNSNNKSVLDLQGQRDQGSKDEKMIPSSKRNFTLTKDIVPPGEGKKSHIGASLPEPVNRNSNNKSVLDLQGQRNQGSKDEKMIPSSKRNFTLTKDIIPPGEGKKSHIGASLPEPVNRNSNNKSVLDLQGQRNQGSKDEKMIPSSKRNFTLTKDIVPPVEGKKSHIGASLPEPVNRNSNSKSVLDLLGQRNQGVNSNKDELTILSSDTSDTSKEEKMIPSSKRNFFLTKDNIPPGEGKKSHIGASLPEPVDRTSNNKSVLDLQGQRNQGSKDEKMIPSSKRNFTLTKDIIPPGEGKKSHIGASLPEPVNRNSNSKSVLDLLGQRNQGVNSNKDELTILSSDTSDTSKEEKMIPSSKRNFFLTKDNIPPGEGKKSHIGASLPEPVNRNSNNKSVLDLQGQRNQGSKDEKMIPSSKRNFTLTKDIIPPGEGKKSPFGATLPEPVGRNSNNKSVLDLLGQRNQGVNSNKDELTILSSDTSDTSKEEKMIPSSKRNFFLTKDNIPPGEGKKSHIGASLPEPVNRNSNNKSVLDLQGQRNQGSKDEKMIPSSKRNFTLTKDIIPPGEGKKSPFGATLPEPVGRNSNNKSVLDLLGQRNQGVNSNKDELTILSSDTSDTSKEEKMIPSSKRNFFLTKDIIPPGEGKKSHIGASLPEPVNRNSNNKSVLDLQGQRNQGSKDEKMIPSSKRNFTLTKDIIPPGEEKKSHIGASLPEPVNRNSNNKSVLEEVDVDNLLSQRNQGNRFGAQRLVVNSNKDELIILGSDSSDTSGDANLCKDEIKIPSSKRKLTLMNDMVSPSKRAHTEAVGPTTPKPWAPVLADKKDNDYPYGGKEWARKFLEKKKTKAEVANPTLAEVSPQEDESKVVKELLETQEQLDMVEEMERKEMEKEKIDEWRKTSKQVLEKNKKEEKLNLQKPKMAKGKVQKKKSKDRQCGKTLKIAKGKLEALKTAKDTMAAKVLEKQMIMKKKMAQKMSEIEALERHKKYVEIKEKMVMGNGKRNRSAPYRYLKK